MTLAQAITMTLNRVGLLPTNTTYKDQARLYLNMASKRVSGEIGGKWWWLHKTTTFNTTKTLTVTGISGTFTAGEIVELDADTTIIGTIDANYDVTNYPTKLLLSSVTGTWVAGYDRTDQFCHSNGGVHRRDPDLCIGQRRAGAALVY